MQDKNEDEILNAKDEFDDPLILELDSIIEELVYK